MRAEWHKVWNLTCTHCSQKAQVNMVFGKLHFCGFFSLTKANCGFGLFGQLLIELWHALNPVQCCECMIHDEKF